MNIDIYVSNINRTKFISIKAGVDVATIQITDPDYQDLSIYQRGTEITAGERRIAFSSDEAIKAIENQGYYLHGASIQVQEN